MTEKEEVLILASKLLDEPNADPDDDLRTLSRQLLRREARIKKLVEALILSHCRQHRYGTGDDEDECAGDDRCVGCRSERLKKEALALCE